MITSERHLTPLDFDRLDLGDLEVDGRQRIEAHAAHCPPCAARRSEHAALQVHFRTVVFPRTETTLRARRWAVPSRRWALGLALPVVTGLVLVSRGLTPGKHDGEVKLAPTIGVKGSSLLLQVFTRRGGLVPEASGQVIQVSDGMRLGPGDVLRFVLQPTGLSYAMIASVDGAGQVSVYFPFHGEASAVVDNRSRLSVPGSIVLDQTRGPERLFAIYSDQPIPANRVRHALAGIAAGGPPAIRATPGVLVSGTLQASLLIEKDSSQ